MNIDKNTNKEKTYFGIRRGEMAFFVAIILGLVIGTLIKKVRLGLLLGLIIGLGIIFLNSIRKKK
ncbi:MAG: hypothetical protein ACK5NK_15100 [Niabella sp.]